MHAQPTVEDDHPDLSPFDCRISDDFKELADCQLVCGSQKMNCHSQVPQQPCRGLVMRTAPPAAVIARAHTEPHCHCCCSIRAGEGLRKLGSTCLIVPAIDT